MSGTVESLRVECTVHFGRAGKGARKELRSGSEPPPPCEPGRVPRVARLLALAHRFEKLLGDGAVRDCAELARLGLVSRARVSQVMALLGLAPDLQEAVLFLPRVLRGRDPVQMYHLLPIARVLDWKVQRTLWAALTERTR